MPPRSAGLSAGAEGAALARAPALGIQAERVLVREQVVEAGPIGGIERDGHRSGGVVADGAPRLRLQGVDEGGPPSCALEQERRQGGFAELRLGHRGDHARRHPRGALAPGCGRHERHLMALA